MTRIPFIVLAIAGTAIAWLITRTLAPGWAPGVTLGTSVAGLSAAAAVGLLGRWRARAGGGGSAEAQLEIQALMRGFAGLMLVRMVGYLTFIGAVVLWKPGDPLSFCAGLIAGTVVFQVIEVIYVRKMS